jgi:hypothetical protein
LFGASRWEKFPGLDNPEAAPAYVSAAEKIRRYLRGGLGLNDSNILDLFDDKDSMIDQDSRIRQFLRRRGGDLATVSDIVIFFIGHGSTLQDQKFIFVVRSTARDQRDITAYKSETLARALKEEAPLVRRWLFLDCCVAARAYPDLQPSHSAMEVLKEEASRNYPQSGTALFAACSANDSAYASTTGGGLMFTDSLTGVLERGDDRFGELLTLSELKNLVRAELLNRYGPDASLPEVSDPDERWGELSLTPFFPNAAKLKDGFEAQLIKLQTGIANFQKNVLRRLDGLDAEIKAQREKHDELVADISRGLTSQLAGIGSSSEAPVPNTEPHGTLHRVLRRIFGASEAGTGRTNVMCVSDQLQRTWDTASAGYRASTSLRTLAIILLARTLVHTILTSSKMDIPEVIYSLIFSKGVELLCAGISLLMAFGLSALLVLSVRISYETNFEVQADSTLVRTDPLLRRILYRKYCITPFGSLDVNLGWQTAFISLASAALGLLSPFLFLYLYR